jgi:hypothetical protein
MSGRTRARTSNACARSPTDKGLVPFASDASVEAAEATVVSTGATSPRRAAPWFCASPRLPWERTGTREGAADCFDHQLRATRRWSRYVLLEGCAARSSPSLAFATTSANALGGPDVPQRIDRQLHCRTWRRADSARQSCRSSASIRPSPRAGAGDTDGRVRPADAAMIAVGARDREGPSVARRSRHVSRFVPSCPRAL